MDNDFSYEQSLWDGVVFNLVSQGKTTDEVITAATALLAARRAAFPRKS